MYIGACRKTNRENLPNENDPLSLSEHIQMLFEQNKGPLTEEEEELMMRQASIELKNRIEGLKKLLKNKAANDAE